MKRFLIWVFAFLFVAGSAFAAKDWTQKTFAGSGGTQTYSFITTDGFYGTSWTVLVTGGTTATITFQGLGGREDKTLVMRDGTAFSMPSNVYPIDSLTVSFSPATGYCDVIIVGDN